MANDIEIIIRLDGQEQVVKVSKESADALAKLGTQAKVTDTAVDGVSKTSTKSVGAMDSLRKSINNLIGAYLGMQAIQFATRYMMDGIKAGIAYEKMVNRVQKGLEQNGLAALDSGARLAEYAGYLENLTGVEEEAIIAGQGLLVQLAKLSGEGLDRASRAALDLAAGLGVSVDQAFTMVAKGAAGNVTMFQRLGMTVQDTGKKGIDLADVLTTIEGKFQGQAEKAGESGAALRKLQDAYGDYQRDVGIALMKNEKFNEILNKVTGSINGNKGSAEELAGVLAGLISVVEKIGQAFYYTGMAIGFAASKIAQLIEYMDKLQSKKGPNGMDVGPITPEFIFAKGGVVPQYFAGGGGPRGTDTVPAWLTPGEMVLDVETTNKFRKWFGYSSGGLVGYYAKGGKVNPYSGMDLEQLAGVAGGVLTDEQVQNLEDATNEYFKMIDAANEYYEMISKRENEISALRMQAIYDERERLAAIQTQKLEWQTENEEKWAAAAITYKKEQIKLEAQMTDRIMERLQLEEDWAELKRKSSFGGSFVDSIKQQESMTQKLGQITGDALVQMTDAWGAYFQAIGAGTEMTAQQVGAMALNMVGGLAATFGQYMVLRGVASIAEGGWPPNPAAIAAGGAQIAAGMALIALGNLAQGAASKQGGGSASSSAKGSYGGGGHKREKDTGGANTITVNVYGHYVDTKKFTKDYIMPGLGDELAKSGGGKKKNKIVTKYR